MKIELEEKDVIIIEREVKETIIKGEEYNKIINSEHDENLINHSWGVHSPRDKEIRYYDETCTCSVYDQGSTFASLSNLNAVEFFKEVLGLGNSAVKDFIGFAMLETGHQVGVNTNEITVKGFKEGQRVFEIDGRLITAKEAIEEYINKTTMTTVSLVDKMKDYSQSKDSQSKEGNTSIQNKVSGSTASPSRKRKK